ncbi:MAG: hypothetical protein AAFR32_07240 [Pseudomonadota bacterium]
MDIGLKVGFGFLSYWLLRLAGVPFETFVVLIVVLVIGYPIGWILGSRIGAETDVDTRWYKTIGWANFIAWLFPIVGVAVAEFTSGIAKESVRSRFFYEGTSFLGYAFVIISVAFSVPLMLEEQKQAELYGDAVPSPESDAGLSGERSFDRCPYAAVERWSEIEVEIYCNRGPPKEDMDGIEMGHKG